MTVFLKNSSIFQSQQKSIKFGDKEIKVIDGANELVSLNLCGVNIDYKQYQKLQITIPSNTTDYLLNFQILGLYITFLTIVPEYDDNDDEGNNFITWGFEGSNDPDKTLTNILVLSGSTNNPIPNILVTNPSTNCSITLNILVAAGSNDYLNDEAAFIYLTNLLFTSIHTYGDNKQTSNSPTFLVIGQMYEIVTFVAGDDFSTSGTGSYGTVNTNGYIFTYNGTPPINWAHASTLTTGGGILEFYNSSGIVAGTLNVSDIIDISRVALTNRIIISTSSSSNIVLDFTTNYDTLQALSSISWLLADPITRFLPTSADVTGPVITLSGAVVGGNLPITLSSYSDNFTIHNLISVAITSIIDARDGSITSSVEMFRITLSSSVYNTITMPGTYLVTMTASDLAGNSTVVTFNIVAS